MARILLIILIISFKIFPQNRISVIDIKGFINQATANFVCDNFEQLNHKSPADDSSSDLDSKADCILINFDSQGGCIDAITRIANTISNSGIPVITFIMPEKELTFSNSLLIPFASSIIAIPPGKVIKRSNDLDKFQLLIDSVNMVESYQKFVTEINKIAVLKKRNFSFIQRSFSGDLALNSDFAHTLHLVDFLTDNNNDLLAKLNGQNVNSISSSITLKTLPVQINHINVDIISQALEILKNPILAYFLLILGLFNLIWGINSSQKISSISSALILLCVSFYVIYSLPVNSTGIFLIIISFAVFAVGVKVPSFGILQIAGTVILFIGSLLMMDIYQSLGVLYIPLYLIISVCVISLLIFLTAKSLS